MLKKTKHIHCKYTYILCMCVYIKIISITVVLGGIIKIYDVCFFLSMWECVKIN